LNGDRTRQLSTPDDLTLQLTASYLSSLGITEPPVFVGDVRVSVIPPKQMTLHGVLILGAYPTAKFNRFDGHKVPVENITEPFDPETASGKELDDYYLNHLGISRPQCWITNLLKVFLFKPEHIRPADATIRHLARDEFNRLASSPANLEWLATELRIAAPRLVITLGREVAGIVRRIHGGKQQNALLTGLIEEHEFASTMYRWVHLPHPGIVMRGESEQNAWPNRHKEFCAALRSPVKEILTK